MGIPLPFPVFRPGNGASVRRILSTQPSRLGAGNERSSGWNTKAASLPNGELRTVTATNPKETLHIRGLGFIGPWYERDIAERAAWSAPGVTEVQDRLTIEP